MFLPALGEEGSAQQVRAERLLGGNENPPVISDGSGRFRARLLSDRIPFRLSYDFESAGSEVLQAHLHIANPGNNGGIVVWLCSNIGSTPEGATQRDCPLSSGEVTGDIVAEDVQTVTVTEGEPPEEVTIIEAGDLDGLKRLIEQSSLYANVHTVDHEGGEIRGQLEPRRR
ncbi:MAG: CHRD domain-containing protein [Geminicoccaceae bacterium]